MILTYRTTVLCLLGLAWFLPAGPASGAIETSRLLDVPFFSDKSKQCGPASLASVLNFYGREITPEELKEEVYIERLQGALPTDLLLTARKKGLEAKIIEGDWETLTQSIDEGKPLIVYLQRGLKSFPKGHFMTVTGYDLEKPGVFAHSGGKANAFYSKKKLLKRWERTKFWTLDARPPNE